VLQIDDVIHAALREIRHDGAGAFSVKDERAMHCFVDARREKQKFGRQNLSRIQLTRKTENWMRHVFSSMRRAAKDGKQNLARIAGTRLVRLQKSTAKISREKNRAIHTHQTMVHRGVMHWSITMRANLASS
jgi:hypothetical protein